jgi:prolyl oligopeptidase
VQSRRNPVLIRIETRAGHGAGKPTSKVIEESADRLAFTAHALGIPALVDPAERSNRKVYEMGK